VGLDWVPGVEAALARRDAGAARRLRGWLRRLEWESRLRAGRAFYRRPRAERAALLARRAGSPGLRLLGELLAEAAGHSSGA